MSTTMAKNVDSRAEYLKRLTDSLSAASSVIDHRGTDEQTVGETSTLLQKFGHESVTSATLTPNHSVSGSLDIGYPSQGRAHSSGKALLNSFAALGTQQRASTTNIRDVLGDTYNPELSKSDFLEQDSVSNIGDGAHSLYLLNKEKGNLRNTKLVSGSQFRLTTKPGRTHQCGQCVVMDKLNRKQKETIRTLKLQLTRLEELCHDLKRTKASDVAQQIAMKSSLELAQSGNDHLDFFAKKCETLEDELAKVKKILTFERNANEGLRNALDETKTSLKKELTDAQNENGRIGIELESVKDENIKAKKQIEDLNNSLMLYKQQLEKSENKLSDCQLRLQNQKSAADDVGQLRELQKLKTLLSEQETSQRSLNAQLRQKDTDLIHIQERLQIVEQSVAGIESDKADLQTQLNRAHVELRTSQETLHATKKRCDVLEGTVKSTIEQRQSVQTQLRNTEAELGNAQYTIREMEKDVNNLNARVDDLLRKLTMEGENAKKAIEKAITGSVRLCVVAPTVNVQVAESKKLRFKSETAKDQLKQFLDNEILKKYSFLYKQKSDNAAPHGGSMEDWLQKMLAQMQSSIEQHVNSAMDGSSL